MRHKTIYPPSLGLAVVLLVCLLASACGKPEPPASPTPTLAPPTQTETIQSTNTLPPSPSPTISHTEQPIGEGPLIAFISDRDGKFDIYLTDPEASFMTRLTDVTGNAYFPEFTSAGDRIMYWVMDLSVSPVLAEIRIMTTDGARDWPLGPALGWSAWSPDGNEVLLVSISSSDNEDILHIDSQGNPTWLTTDPAKDREPDWSPDGAAIAFTSYRDGVPHIYLMNTDGSNQRRLTTYDMVELEPDWSPDGGMIAFVSGDDINTQIFIVDADGTNLQQLTDSPGYNENPAWSPDGTQLAFWSDRSGNREIYIINIDGTDLIQITNHPADDENPTWSP